MGIVIFWPCTNHKVQYFEEKHSIYGWPDTKFGIFIVKIAKNSSFVDNRTELLGYVHKDNINILYSKLKLNVAMSISSEKVVFYNPRQFNILYISNYSDKEAGNDFININSHEIRYSNDLISCLVLASSINVNNKSNKSKLFNYFVNFLYIISHIINLLFIDKFDFLKYSSVMKHISGIINDINSINIKLQAIRDENDIKKILKVQEEFYAKLSFCLIDLVLGIIIFPIFFYYGIIMIEFCKKKFFFYQKIVIDIFIDDIAFALKPNPNLSIFIGNIFLSILVVIKTTFTNLPRFYFILNFMWIYSFLLGFTFQYHVLRDTFRICTLHFRYCYIISKKMFKKTFDTLVPLLHLFRGKKRNTLTNKIENETYKQDELYLGTMLFITIGCLFYTITFYYLIYIFLIGPIYIFESLFNIIYTVYRSFATEIVNNMCKFTRINVIIKDGRVHLTN